MKILSIDYGRKNIGLAYADSGNSVAMPLETIFVTNAGNVISQLRTLIDERKIERVVIGLPLNFRFEETEICSEIRRFAGELKQVSGIEVVFVNEVLTTDLSKQIMGNGKKDDSVAAQILLQDYLAKYHEHLEK